MCEVSIKCRNDNTPKARQGKMTCDVSHLYQVIPLTPVYVCIYYISGHKWSSTHRVLKSQRSSTGVIYMQSWKHCALPVITTMGFWKFMYLGTWWTMLQPYIMNKFLSYHTSLKRNILLHQQTLANLINYSVIMIDISINSRNNSLNIFSCHHLYPFRLFFVS